MKRMHAALLVALVVTLLTACGRITLTLSPSPTVAATVAPTSTSLAVAPTRTAIPTQVPTRTPNPTQLPATKPAATPDAEQDELLAAADAIGSEMETIRGLDATQPITNGLMSRSEVAGYMQQELDREHTPEEWENDTRAMAAFDFIPEDYDLRAELLDLYSAQVAGFYDDEKNTLYVVSDTGLDLIARLTLAHEITHALQDERFNLNAFLDEDRMSDDEILARRALAEGDATLAMTAYLMNHVSDITEEDMAALQSEEIQASEQQLAEAPAIIRETLNFPYTYGETFVSALYEEGWDAVDAAYADPPVTTEQVLHPEKYLTRDEPQIMALPPLTATLGSGWRLAEANTRGEFQTSLYLAQQLDEETAAAASQGWDGDQYAVYVNGGDEVLVLVTAWDSRADREEFVSAYADYAQAKYGQAGRRDGDALTWDSPSQAAYLGWNEATTVIVLGPNRVTVDRVVAATNG